MIFQRSGGDATETAVSSSTSTDIALTGSGSALLVVVLSGDVIYFKSGVGAQTSTNADIPLGHGTHLIRIPFDHDHVAVIGRNSGRCVVMHGEAS